MLFCRRRRAYNPGRLLKGIKMIVTIGGAGCCGKTFLAQKLLERYAIPYVSLDHLKMGLIRSGEDLDVENDDQVMRRLWPVARGIMEVNIENRQNIILEGCYLPAEGLKELQEKYPGETAFFYIGFSAGYVGKYFAGRILRYRNAIEKRRYDETRSPEEIVRENEEVRKNCLKNGIKFFEIGEDFNSFVQDVFHWLDGKEKMKFQYINHNSQNLIVFSQAGAVMKINSLC